MRFAVALSVGLGVLATPAVGADNSYTPARKLDGDEVEFPVRARIRQNDAFLHYSYTVSTTGAVEDARIEYSNNIPEFENAVVEWLQTQSFAPATRDGKAVASKQFGWWTFNLKGKAQGASRKFGRSFRDAIVALKAGKLDKVAKNIDRMESLPQRSVFEEIWLQYTWLRYHNARGDVDSAYRRLVVLKRYMQRDAISDPEHRVEKLSFYQPILDDAYHYEARHHMVDDARATLGLYAKYFPDAPRTKELAKHFVALLAETAGKGFDTRGVLLPNPLYRNEPRWVGRLTKEQFSISLSQGSVSAISVYCDDREAVFSDAEISQSPWQAPGQWAGCLLHISGEPGTQFLLNQHSP